MRERLQIPSAMWRVNFDLLGGVRRTTAAGVGYAMIVTVGLVGFRQLFADTPTSTFADTAVPIIASFQALIIIIGGANAIFRALTRDFDTKMIESHRLSPMSNISIVLGYMFGPTIQITVLFLVNLVIGTMMTILAKGSVPDWLIGNAVLYVGATVAWAITVFGGVKLSKPFNPMGFIMPVGFLSALWLVIPGGGLLSTSFSNILAWRIMGGHSSIPQVALAIVLLVDFSVILFWLSAAAAKYRRPDLPALNALRGMIFLVVWLLVGSASVWAFELITSKSMISLHNRSSLSVQWVCTMISAIVMATVPISGAVGCSVLVGRGTAPRDWSDRASELLVTVLSGFLIVGIMALVGWKAWHLAIEMQFNPEKIPQTDLPLWKQAAVRAWVLSGLTCMLALLTMRNWLVFIYNAAKKPRPGAAILLFLVWVAPTMGDYVRALVVAERDGLQHFVASWLFSCSPVGTLLIAWGHVEAPLRIGLIFQAVIAVITAWMAWRVKKSKTHQALPTPA